MEKPSARGEVIRKALFLIGNRHFLIRKCHFGICGWSYVERVYFGSTPIPFLSGVTPMIRRRLLIATAVIASVVLAACSDMTAPKPDVCPITSGSQTC